METTIVEYFHAQPEALWYALGFAMLAIEAGILGLGSGVLLFAGLGAVSTGLLISVGILSGTQVSAIAAFVILSSLWTVILWRVFRKLQSRKPSPPPPASDFVGHRFVLKGAISHTETANERFSGIVWRVELDPEATIDTVAAGQRVRVTSLDAGIFRVVPVT